MENYTLAKFYDILLYPFLNNIRKRTSKIILQLNPESIIDICCGTGNQLKFLKNSTIQLTGIDNSIAMLKASKGLNCFAQDARNIQFPDHSFDMALIQLALHEKSFDDQQDIINEAYRIIKPGGHLLILDYEIDKNTKAFSRHVINFIEFIAGKEHYNYFKQYHKNNCTYHLINPEQFSLKRKIKIAGNSMLLQLFEKKTFKN